MIAFKLMRKRRDGSLGPLFINAQQRIPLNVWLEAECHPTPGFAIRPGWHVTRQPVAPHLTMKGRVWTKVEVQDVTEFKRPICQGGIWWLAKRMRVIEVINQPTKDNTYGRQVSTINPRSSEDHPILA